jgi:hypothetical protein
MLAEDGSVKILDFGLARWVADPNSLGLTQAGTLMGSPHYMSPEQISGQPVDQRSDIFAVGAVFYELLTYQKAFAGESMATILHRIVSADPTPARAVCPDLEPELEAIIARALKKAPDDRYPTLQEMLQDLGRVMRLRPSPSEDDAGPQRAVSYAQQRDQVAVPSTVHVHPERDQPSTVVPGRRGLWLAGIALAGILVVLGISQLTQREPLSPAGGNNPDPSVATAAPPDGAAGSAGAASGNAAAPEPVTPAGATPVQLVEQARGAYKEGRIRPAIDLALAALKVDGSNKEAQAFLADVRDEARKATVVEREAAIRSGADSASADYAAATNAERLAEGMRNPDVTERAVEQYRVARERYQAAGRTAESARKAAAARAAEIDTLLAQVDEYISAGNFQAATVLVDQALGRDSLNPRLHQTREKVESAERNWRAREQEQESRDIRALLARVEKLADPQQRETALMDAQGKYPKSSDIRAALARTREEMKRTTPAPLPTRSVDRNEILQTMALYAEAFASLSQEKFLSVYPDAPQKRLQGLSSQRSACRKLQVTFDENRLKYVVADERVIVDIPVQYECAQPTAGRRLPASTTLEQLTLSRRDGRWVIVAMAER